MKWCGKLQFNNVKIPFLIKEEQGGFLKKIDIFARQIKKVQKN